MTPKEILARLDAEVPKFAAVAAVMGFENGDWFILGNDPNRESLLNSLKGIVTGLVSITLNGNVGVASIKIFPEWLNVANIEQHLQTASAVFAGMYNANPNRTKSFFVDTEKAFPPPRVEDRPIN